MKEVITISTKQSTGTQERVFIGPVLRKLRKAQQLSQEELAGEFTSRSHISKLENNEKCPTSTMIFYLAGELEILPSEFIRQIEEDIQLV